MPVWAILQSAIKIYYKGEYIMLNDFWKQFKSGTDIRGVAVSSAGFEVNLTEKTVTAMVNGFILWLSAKTVNVHDYS